mmetsp:Transcript_42937/g.63700  ORF Transcript_42937/g.63700 Transcript_42937/m.63700 type:complete len:241 (+) Transcript_42937:241-963(+)
MIRSLLFSLCEYISARATCQSHDGWSSSTEIGTTCPGCFGSFNHGEQIFVQLLSSLRLMQLVLHTPLEIVQIACTKGMNQKGYSTDVKGSFFSCHGCFENASSITRLANKVRYEHDQLKSWWCWDAFCNPPCAVVNPKLNASVDGRSYIVRVALNLSSNLQESFTSPTWQSMSCQYKASNNSSNNSCATTTKTTSVRDSTHNVILECWHGLLRCFKRRLETNYQIVGFVLGNGRSALTFC